MSVDALDATIVTAALLMQAAGWRRRRFAPMPGLELLAAAVGAGALVLALLAHPDQVAIALMILAMVMAWGAALLAVFAAIELTLAAALRTARSVSLKSLRRTGRRAPERARMQRSASASTAAERPL
jgi:hypothetical protein